MREAERLYVVAASEARAALTRDGHDGNGQSRDRAERRDDVDVRR